MRTKSTALLCIGAIAALVLGGCGAAKAPEQPKPNGQAPEPALPNGVISDKKVELIVFLNSITRGDLEKYYIQPAKEKFPNFTIRGENRDISQMIAAGEMPDIIVGSKGTISDIMYKNDLVGDVGDLVKKYSYDVTKLEPALVDIMRTFGGGNIIGLPLHVNNKVMYYNKDLFDRFGVAYPKDGLNWDEAYEIAKKMTRVENGVLYRGFSDRWGDTFFAANPFSLSYLSPKEERSTFIENDRWKIIADNFKRFYTLPGLQFDSKTSSQEEDRKIFEKGTSAMSIFIPDAGPKDWNFAWDIVSVPYYTQNQGVSQQVNGLFNYITKGSKNREAAFQFAAWMTSAEMQTMLAKEGRVPALKDEAIKKQFMQNVPLYSGKNIKAFISGKYAPQGPARDAGLVKGFENPAQRLLFQEMQNVIVEGKDLNSAFRDADEAIRKALAAEKAK
ncbi:extracellular solute-binding protein [Paenibacillus ginsengarvi]|uniref:Extracellular solute-binding protein n=1 Tax=Paenibacillus ginsengarvi TaxID=400777 RepID=A0A3B0AVJ2_9BACL|nr:extracellular solute-binding protein [Paenibacillus ginsengarvi]RKN64311.1 extracellular solute-binding protein [Paenibacillus ginsengarvi]